jgi:hypothetical protein
MVMNVEREASGKGIVDLMRPDDIADLETAIAALARRARRLRTALFWGVGPLAMTGTALFAASFGPVNSAPVGSIGIVLIALACGVAVIGQLVWSQNLWGIATRGVRQMPLPDRAERLLDELRSGTAKAWLEPVRGATAEPGPFGSLGFTGPFAPLTLSPKPSVQALGRSPWASGATGVLRFRVSEDLEIDAWRDAEGTSDALTLHLAVPVEAMEARAGPFSRFVHLPRKELEVILRAAYPDFGTEHGTHRSTIIVQTFLIANELVKSSTFNEVTALRNGVLKRLRAIGLDNYSLRESGDTVSSSWMDKALSRAGYESIDGELERAEAARKDQYRAR